MLTLILKGTNACNLDCLYCSVGQKMHSFVDDEMLYQILSYTCELALRRKESEVRIIYHGGEPTLIPAAAYRSAMERTIREYSTLRLSFSIQTNAYIISEAMLDLIEDYGITVGVSIDGSNEIHDFQRITSMGEKTYGVVVRNIDRMLSRGISVACLMVLSSKALSSSHEYLHFFADRHLHLKINPLLDIGEACNNPALLLKPGDYANYLIGMFQFILEKQIDVSVSPIDSILAAVLGEGRVCECTFDPCCNHRYICIDYNGDIFPCGRFSDLGDYRLSNIACRDYSVLDSDAVSRLISRRTTELSPKCSVCKYYGMCNAGCNAEAIVEGRFSDAPLLCADYTALFDFFSHEGLKLYRDYLLRHRERLMRFAR